MKKAISIVICLSIVLSISIFAHADYRGFPEGNIPMRVTGTGVRCRTGPGTNYEILGMLNYPDIFWVNDNDNSPWYGGRADSSTAIYAHYTNLGYDPIPYGYVHSDYLGSL